MKILFIVTQSEFGGAQRYVYEIAKSLSSQGDEILVAAGGDGTLISKIPACQAGRQEKSKTPARNASYSDAGGQIKSQKLKYLKRVPGAISAFLGVWEIYKLLKKEKPDVLFLNSTVAGILGSIAGRFYKKTRVIYRIGGWSFRDPRPAWQNKIILWLEKWTARFKHKIIVNCEIDRELAIKYKIAPEEKIVKIYNGLNVDKLEFFSKEQARQKLLSGSHPDSKIVGTVANFYRTKGLRYLIEAAHILNTKYKILNTKYLIIGDGHLRPELERQIKKYGPQNSVFLTGRIPDGYKYLKAFDVFVLPSLKEGFPWIILEAMASLVPIVATKVGAVPEIIEQNKEGILVEPKNSQELAEKIAWLLQSPNKSRQIAALAKQKLIQQFTLEKMLAKTKEVLTSV